MGSETGELTVRDGITLRTRRWSAEDPKGNVVLVHGVAEHSGRWEHVGAFLADRGYNVLAYDWRGHGESEGLRAHIETFENMVDDLDEVMRSVEGELPLFVYGHSGGALTATAHAVSDRDQPQGFVLSATALSADIPLLFRVAAKVLPKVAPKLRLKNPIDGAHLSRDPAVAEAYFADPLLEPAATAQSGGEILAAMDRTRAQLHQIRVPVLVVHGADDQLVPPSASAPLAAVPTARRRLYAGLRHEIHNEPEQDEVLGEIADWLDEQASV